jgi:1-acyl-sn-glycerol-3-phosphate acyltransferase
MDASKFVDSSWEPLMNLTIFNTPILSDVLRAMSRGLLKLLGWRVEGTLPDTKKFVLIAAPHTSNWDAFYMIMVAFVFRVNLHWMGKASLFDPPQGFLMRFFGGISVGRSKDVSTVDKAIRVIDDASDLVLAVPPEGSRQKVRYWKTGFYYIARGAKVPIVMGYLDFANKRTGVGPALMPSGDLEQDFRKIRAFYKPFAGKYPDDTSATRLQDE